VQCCSPRFASLLWFAQSHSTLEVATSQPFCNRALFVQNPANVRPYHVSTAGFAPYNFFFRYDMFGKLDAASCALAPVHEELLASGNFWHFCSWFQKQRGEKGRGLQVSEGGNGALLAISNYWQFCTCLAEAEGEGLRGLLAYQGWTVQLLALLLLLEAEGGRGVLVQDAVECTLLASGNSWHCCSKQVVRLLIYHRQSLTTDTFAPALRQQRCGDYWYRRRRRWWRREV